MLQLTVCFMKPVFSNYFSTFLFRHWPWVKGVFYTLYFLFIQLTNSAYHEESSLIRLLVNILFCTAAISVVEISQLALRLTFRRRCYKKAISHLIGSYLLLATAGYVVFHGQNVLANEVWDRRFEASLTTFIPGFTAFYGAFFKYGVILFMLKQLLLLLRLLGIKKIATHPIPPDRGVEVATPTDQQNERRPMKVLSIKVGATTYMLDVNNIAYLEVQDETTTVYERNGSSISIKKSLSELFARLPKDRFVRIHDSRVVALAYIKKEERGHLYLTGYEDRALKLGGPEKQQEYKEWKERNRIK